MEATFNCSICGEASRHICIFCTKDACRNHLCERCHRCSDCCECEMPLTSSAEEDMAAGETEPRSLATGQPVEFATPAS